ncbi:protein of unknown function [Saccharicrinis carchari]|uniref:3-keto-alpha-glucoside-1,2-lyase/3-keto-2-hydroxy-glucal hydratase domain-containing protein n=1 Tax=Saccharicrinis carchari TaxID=1168039 RepID=A0A521B1C3_SACCC|nr:family 16 glycoside hydrolase [Saccharicrinis carchari]SMO40913.1 protein of unknown function [Saccharicrinis carchari]
MKQFFSVALAAVLITSCVSQNKMNTLTEQEKQEGWELLFDGKTTKGWHTFGKKSISGWTVKDGVLHNSGIGSDSGGDIATDEVYDSFELYLEWKATNESNSGIFYLADEKFSDVIYETGPEYQLLDDKGWPTELSPSQYSGANYDMNPPVGAEVKPLDEFNVTRIIVDGPHVEHWLNGKKVVEYELWSPQWYQDKANSKWAEFPNYGMAKKGRIGLQDHGGLTMFRNIKIRRL